ncbi:GNAT family acetyltransferase [Actinotalea ferrariae CF5-4]|uniref:GNAT family acetyltransferase n=1 Tax=Actinotalea ferrariae CF5-4 TaxID=948458 RepID=A0A021VR95_9CELL|nr:GNAT family N-acetyltransferase [Actinotalea ferrariae]EYR62560.1 GNAT family acetyltransferase [Actinotalea ferrariae CF5-4]
MALFRETADVSVRPATPGDEAAIARTQLRAWRSSHAEVLGADVLDRLDAVAVQEQWAQAVSAPPSSAHRVLVACDGPRVVGFVASAPVEDGVELVALEVDPDHQRGGHGSRLLAACVDLARETGAGHVRTWVLEGDVAREQFLGAAGLGPDGSRRELASDGPDVDGAGPRSVAEHRWSAEI